MYYNFVRLRQSLRVTSAMAAGVMTNLWSLLNMVGIIEDWEARNTPKLADRLQRR
jgi:hypothetical protein